MGQLANFSWSSGNYSPANTRSSRSLIAPPELYARLVEDAWTEVGMTHSRDLFICHASGDKNAVARPLAEALSFLGVRVWFDEYEIRAGDSLREIIDRGLREARMGAVILSPSFLKKGWAQTELDALVTRQARERRTVVFPIWHRMSQERLARYSEILAARKGVSTYHGLDVIVDNIAAVLFGDRTGQGPVPSRRHVLEFFNARNNLPTALVYNREYPTPTPKEQRSTTDKWLFEIQQTFATLKRIGAAKRVMPRPTNYHPSTLSMLLRDRFNIVSYASSKINPCTENILEGLNRRLDLGVRFVYQADAASGKQRSVFTPDRKGERVALLFRGRVLEYSENAMRTEGRDYGIVIRVRPSRRDNRLWVVFAGCGRPASVASWLLVFDDARGRPLWRRLRSAGPLRSFAAAFEVRYTPAKNTEPTAIRILDVVNLE